MKRIIFLIIASLLVLGLVLPGCAPGDGVRFTDWINVGIICPMDIVHGQQQWLCAEWARDEINAAGGVNITIGGNTTTYGIRLTKINTRTEEDPALANAALDGVIDDIQFVIGGFRSETVFPLVETTMNARKIFYVAGAATGDIMRLVAWNATRYNYLFRGTPFNDVFLLTNLYKWLGSLSTIFAANNITPPYRLGVIAENLAWTARMRAILATDPLGRLAAMGYTNATVTLCSPTDSTVASQLEALAAINPIVVMPILSAALPGTAYSNQRMTYLPNAISFGINVAAQVQAIWTATGGACKGEMFLDTFGDGCNITTKTASFLSGFATRCTLPTGDYPMYTASVYDILHALVASIRAANSLNSDDVAAQIRLATTETAAARRSTVYPMPAITLVARNATPGSGVFALNASQANALYPHLVPYYSVVKNKTYANLTELAAAWMSDELFKDWTSNPGGFIPHDLVYGPNYTTGLVTQWQNITGVGKKVAIWPNVIRPEWAALANVPAQDIYAMNATLFASLVGARVIDQYGSWIINYPGAQAPWIDPAVIAYWQAQ